MTLTASLSTIDFADVPVATTASLQVLITTDAPVSSAKSITATAADGTTYSVAAPNNLTPNQNSFIVKADVGKAGASHDH